MSNLLMFAWTQVSTTAERLVQREGRERVMSLSHQILPAISDDCVAYAKSGKELAGYGPEDKLSVFECAGQKFKPMAYGDECIVLDVEHLNAVPSREIATFLVAERVEQVLLKRQRQESRLVATSLAVGTVAGGLWLSMRLGKPRTLRRCITLSCFTTCVTATAMGTNPLFTTHLAPLSALCSKVKETHPDLLHAVYEYETANYAVLLEKKESGCEHMALNPSQKDVEKRLVDLELFQVSGRLGAIYPFLKREATPPPTVLNAQPLGVTTSSK
eukprot:Rhum_TRINITY_DN23290_c0_g1::Rhum_TRINITY_DN23290_c0_g1_i1::g.177606::m.177606